jgi:hypothetical protein
MKKVRRLSKGQILLAPKKSVKVNFDFQELDNFKMCPFCLYRGPVRGFLQMNKNGDYLKSVVCPDCKTNFLLRTLTIKMTVKEFAKWVFDYNTHGDFFRKSDFFRFNARLKAYFIANEFWSEYKALKGASQHEESYSEYMNRQGEEFAREQE